VVEDNGDLGDWLHRLGQPGADWLDLASGISPFAWQAPTPPPAVWQCPPQQRDGLVEAAAAYYGTSALVPVPGVPAALALLPWLRERCRVGVVEPGYSGHGAAWKRAGHQVMPVSAAQMSGGVGTAFDVLVVANPNDPDGTYCDPDRLLEWRHAVVSGGGWMIVDETYVDATPGYSLAPRAPLPGQVVRRSLGEVFGLAGMRLGFAFGAGALLEQLEAVLGARAVDAPARWVARQALADTAWQQRIREHLAREAERLGQCLGRHFNQRIVGTPFFRTVLTPHAPTIQEALAREAILVRLLERQDGLRFGLPPDAAAYERLQGALARAVGEPTRA
jgi:histidinol-phosphate/aromatic aminotransferase/cobyric acid decarboxylase-like protein